LDRPFILDRYSNILCLGNNNRLNRSVGLEMKNKDQFYLFMSIIFIVFGFFVGVAVYHEAYELGYKNGYNAERFSND